MMNYPISCNKVFYIFIAITILFSMNTLNLLASENLEAKIAVEIVKKRPINIAIFGFNTLGYDYCRNNIKSKNCFNNGKYSNYGAGQWDPKNRKPDEELLNLSKEIKPTSFRFPGGDGTFNYDWKETIGPLELRPNFKFGLDEFLELCDRLNAVPIITLNYSKGIDHIIDMVEYLNSDLNSRNPNGGVNWANVRAKNGHPQPYSVKYFEFGNEVYHGDYVRIPAENPVIYANNYITFQMMLKSVSPNSQLGAVLQGWAPGMTFWDMIVSKVIKEKMDFGIIHTYAPNYRGNQRKLDGKELFAITLAAPYQIRNWIELIHIQLNNIANKKIPLAITEYNGSFIQDHPIPYRHSLGNALFIADVLQMFLKLDIPILFANYWHLSNGYWGLVHKPRYHDERGTTTEYYKRPNFYVFELYRKHLGAQLVETTVDVPSYVSKALGNVEMTYDGLNDEVVESQLNYKKIDLHPYTWEEKKHKDVKVIKTSDEIVINFLNKKDLNYYHIKKILEINQGNRYRLSGMIKADKLDGLTGLSLEVQDARGYNKVRWAKGTKGVVGSTGWIPVVIEFTPPRGTQFLKIMIRRVGGMGPIEGLGRVRDVTLEDLGKSKRYPPTPYISAIGSVSENLDTCYLIVINKHLEKSITANIEIKGFALSRVAKYWQLKGYDIDATNEKAENSVAIARDKIQIVPGAENFNYNFESHSIYAFELKRL